MAFSVIFFRVSSAGMVRSFLSCSRRARVFAASAAETPRDFLKRQAIEHPIGGHAAFARHLNAPMGQVEFPSRMGVGVDAHHAAEVERALMPAPIQIEPPRIGVDLDGDAVLGTDGENFFHIDLVAGPAQELTPRHVAKDKDWRPRG